MAGDELGHGGLVVAAEAAQQPQHLAGVLVTGLPRVEQPEDPRQPAVPGHVARHVQAADAHVQRLLQRGGAALRGLQARGQLHADDEVQAVEQQLRRYYRYREYISN